MKRRHRCSVCRIDMTDRWPELFCSTTCRDSAMAEQRRLEQKAEHKREVRRAYNRSPERKAAQRARDHRRWHDAQAIINALRELGWLHGYQIVGILDQRVRPVALLPPPSRQTLPPLREKPPDEFPIKCRRGARRRWQAHRERPILCGEIVVVDPNGVAQVVVDQDTRARKRAIKAQERREKGVLNSRKWQLKNSQRFRALTAIQNAERQRPVNRRGYQPTPAYRKTHREAGRSTRAKRKAILEAVRELGLLNTPP